MTMTKIYNKVIETQHSLYLDSPLLKEFQSYNDHINKTFLDQSKKDKNHYLRIMMMNILNKSVHKKQFLFESINNDKMNDVQKEVQIIPNMFNKQNLTNTIGIFKKKVEKFSNLLDIITFSLIPSIFLTFLEERSFENFVDFIISLSNNEEIDFQILLSRSIFVSPAFLQFTHDILYPVFKPPYGKLVSLDNVFLNNEYLKMIQNKILTTIKANIHTCPSYIINFLRALKENSHLSSVQILKKCIFDPIILNPTLFLVDDTWCFENKNETEQISSILSLALTDELIDQIYLIMRNNDSYFNAFLNEKQFDGNDLCIKYHKIIGNIDTLAIEQIQLILEGNDPPNDIIDEIYEKCIKDYSYSFCHIDGEVSPWVIICQILKYLPQLPQTYNKNENDSNDNDEDINFSDFLEIMHDNSVNIDSESRKMQVDILLNQVESIFRKDQSNFTQEEFEKQLDLMAKNQDKIEITLEEIKKLEKKLSLIVHLKQFPISEINELFNTFRTIEIKPEGIQYPNKIEEIISNSLFYTNQFDKYLKLCIEKAKEISGSYDCRKIFYHRYWQNLKFHDYLIIRNDLRKYDFILNDFLSKNYSKIANLFFHPENESNRASKVVYFALKNCSLYEKEMSQIRDIFSNNEDPLSKYVHFEQILSSYFSKILIATNHEKLEADEHFGLEEIFLCLANPPYFISNIVYLNEFINYVNYPNSFIEHQSHYHVQIFYLFESLINNRINKLLDNFKIPIFYLSLNHIKYLTIYISGDDSKLIGLAYRSVLNLLLPKNLLNQEKNLNEFVSYFDKKNEVPEKFILKPDYEEFKNGVTYRVTVKVSKSFGKKDFRSNDNVNNQLVSRYVIFASSCTNEYKFERPEEKFFRLGTNDLQIIAYPRGAKLDNLKDIGGVYQIQLNKLLNFLEQAFDLFV